MKKLIPVVIAVALSTSVFAQEKEHWVQIKDTPDGSRLVGLEVNGIRYFDDPEFRGGVLADYVVASLLKNPMQAPNGRMAYSIQESYEAKCQSRGYKLMQTGYYDKNGNLFLTVKGAREDWKHWTLSTVTDYSNPYSIATQAACSDDPVKELRDIK